MQLGSIHDVVNEVTGALTFLPDWAVAGLVLVLAAVAALVIHWVLRRIVLRVFAARPSVRSLIDQAHALTRLAFVTLALALVLPAVRLPPDVAAWSGGAMRVAFIVLLGWIALVAVDIGVSVYLMRFQLDTADNLLARKHVTQMRVLKRVMSTLVILLTAGAALMTFSAVRQVGVSLFASAGLAGIVAGLAARPVLSNLIAGVQLAVTQPIRLDDAVVVENEMGFIEEITSTYVVVRVWDQRRLVVPLSYFIEKPFQNWTREGTALLGTVMLYLDYAAPIERIRAKAAEIAARSQFWDRQVVGVQVTDAKERTLEVRVLVSAANSSSSFDLRCELREKLIAFLRNECPDALPRTHGELTLHEIAADGRANRDVANRDMANRGMANRDMANQDGAGPATADRRWAPLTIACRDPRPLSTSRKVSRPIDLCAARGDRSVPLREASLTAGRLAILARKSLPLRHPEPLHDGFVLDE